MVAHETHGGVKGSKGSSRLEGLWAHRQVEKSKAPDWRDKDTIGRGGLKVQKQKGA